MSRLNICLLGIGITQVGAHMGIESRQVDQSSSWQTKYMSAYFRNINLDGVCIGREIYIYTPEVGYYIKEGPSGYIYEQKYVDL